VEILARLGQHSAVRFLVVGVASFLADASALWLIHGVLGIWLPVATTLAFMAAFVVNFGLGRTWAFESRGRSLGRQLPRYVTLVAANLVLTVLLVDGITGLGVPYLGSKAVTATILAVVNYLASRTWVFA